MSASAPERTVLDGTAGSNAVLRYRPAFDRLAGHGSAPGWLTRLREESWARFASRGFPTTRDEAWRFTSVAALARHEFRPAALEARPAEEAVSRFTLGGSLGGAQAVFVNGSFAPGLSSAEPPEGMRVLSLREALTREPEIVQPHLGGSDGDVFAFLNAALFEDGAVVAVAPGTVLVQPLHLVFLSTASTSAPTMSHPRSLVLLGRGSQLTLVETYGGPESEAYFTNAVTQIVLEDGAVLDHYRVQREGTAAFHMAETTVRQGRSTSFSSTSLSLGAALARHDLRQVFAGEGGECLLGGLFMGTGTQHTDVHTWVDHAAPHCTTRELYKGVLDGQAHGVFVGKIRVGPGAQKTDAQQTNKNLLLSRQALVDSVPQLEILADDVKCKHGSTTGQLDALALFYLRSRGLDAAAARSLLTYAFVSDVLRRIRPPALRAGLADDLRARLKGVLGGDLEDLP